MWLGMLGRAFGPRKTRNLANNAKTATAFVRLVIQGLFADLGALCYTGWQLWCVLRVA